MIYTTAELLKENHSDLKDIDIKTIAYYIAEMSDRYFANNRWLFRKNIVCWYIIKELVIIGNLTILGLGHWKVPFRSGMP